MPSHELGDVQTALVQSAAELVQPLAVQPGETSLEKRLIRLTGAAFKNVPGADLVGLTLRNRDGGFQSYGQTGEEVVELDHLQVDLGDGPCLEAIRVGTDDVVRVRDFAGEQQRWPQFAQAAVTRGVYSLLSFAMVPVQSVPGAINFYSRSRDGFDGTASTIGGAFATQAALVLYEAREIAHLERALETRDVVGQAKGILMQRHHVDAIRAFDLLVSASQDSNMKLVDVARGLTSRVGSPPAG